MGNAVPVFQPHLDILGIVIYSSEFVLWCGVIACGGYYNLMPWVKEKLQVRRERRENQMSSEGGLDADDGTATLQAVQLHDMPSSTSVFRTPSSVMRRSTEDRLEDR